MSYDVDGHTSTLASKVLGFLVDSGLLYILIGVNSTSAQLARPSHHKPFFFSLQVVLASSIIRLCSATLRDILAPVGV